jgi:hypothetical protein
MLTDTNDKNGKLLTEEDEITQRWTEYVKELFTQQHTYDVEVVSELQRRTGRCDNSGDDDILLDEVQSAIKKLKYDKAPGIGDIPAEMIKAGGQRIAMKLHALCIIKYGENESGRETGAGQCL